MILFLDFDGVLHPFFPRSDRSDEENQLFAYLPRLEKVLRDHPVCRIVITSSWRKDRPWDQVVHAFSPDVVARIIGATPVLRNQELLYSRYGEIVQFLENQGHSECQWIALDDDPDLYPPGCTNLILCEDGFREAEETTLRKMLEAR